jgi:hypothetical protein
LSCTLLPWRLNVFTPDSSIRNEIVIRLEVETNLSSSGLNPSCLRCRSRCVLSNRRIVTSRISTLCCAYGRNSYVAKNFQPHSRCYLSNIIQLGITQRIRKLKGGHVGALRSAAAQLRTRCHPSRPLAPTNACSSSYAVIMRA